MVKSFDLLQHYPDRWRELKEIQAIVNTDLLPVIDENGEVVSDVHTLQHLYDYMEQELKNSLISPYGDSPGADIETCKRWEKMLGIVPNTGATLEDRVFVIKLRLVQTAPYSLKTIQTLLDNLIGKGQSTLIRDVDDKSLEVILGLRSRFQIESVREMLDNMIPADMKLNMKIDYTTHDDMAKYDHDFLSQYTHDEIPITEM